MSKCPVITAASITVVVVVYMSFMDIIHTMPAPIVTPTPGLKLHCQNILNKTPKKLATPRTPPWFSNATIRSSDNLYVWPEKVNKYDHRLGNRLFNYASTFGIAWRNCRVPILPPIGKTDPQYDLVKFFNFRMPVDEGNQIIQVHGDRFFYCILPVCVFCVFSSVFYAHVLSSCLCWPVILRNTYIR